MEKDKRVVGDSGASGGFSTFLAEKELRGRRSPKTSPKQRNRRGDRAREGEREKKPLN